MNLPSHLSANILTSMPLKHYLHLDWPTIFIFISLSVLLDLDHILFFIFKEKSFDPTVWLKVGRQMRQTMTPGLYIFHSPEFNIILFILSFFNKTILVFLLACLIHIMLDSLEHYRYHKNFSWFKKWSIFYNIKSLI